MAFAENLRNLRNMKGISQKELADILKISLKTISHWETGYCEPSISQLIALSELFDVTVDDLIKKEI